MKKCARQFSDWVGQRVREENMPPAMRREVSKHVRPCTSLAKRPGWTQAHRRRGVRQRSGFLHEGRLRVLLRRPSRDPPTG